MGIKARLICIIYKNILIFKSEEPYTLAYIGNVLLKLESQGLKKASKPKLNSGPNKSSQISKSHEKTSSGEIFRPLISFYDRVIDPVDGGEGGGVIYLDRRKLF